MSAKEMFEKLGYEEEHHISYIKFIKKLEQNCCDDVKELQIWFYQSDESFGKIGGMITMEELQAINKQAEELGWLGEDK